ncbi:hypothetical protein I3843_04G131300 [Carya illinoinensis]|nr:hypothetical protein I3843_04G131300 [Carya illinoinensis]
MVPVYATESIISLLFPRLSLACDILRNCYEAFALYSFGSYLVACLGGERMVIELLENNSRKQLGKQLLEGADENRSVHQKSYRNFFFQPCILGEHLLVIIKFGLVQYLSCWKSLVFMVMGNSSGTTVVLNFSQMWALYCLVTFYNVTHERLQSINPLAKFISFKVIVFATWWQGVGIALLSAFGVLPKEVKVQAGLQNFLICIEMAIAAIAHVYVFSAEPYQFLPVSEYGRVTTETSKEALKLEKGPEEKPAMLERTETKVESPGTSVTESVQDIVLEGGQHVSSA